MITMILYNILEKAKIMKMDLKKLYKWTYLQNRLTDLKNKLIDY